MYIWREEGANHFWNCKFSLTGVFGVSWAWPEVSLGSPAKATHGKPCGSAGESAGASCQNSTSADVCSGSVAGNLHPRELVRKQLQCKMTVD